MDEKKITEKSVSEKEQKACPTKPERSGVSFKDTLNLPTTNFPIRPNAKEDDPKMVARWASEDIYKKTFEKNAGKTKFILHDGPPYANGNLHLGHAYNKILKDIVTKSQRMMGKHTPVTPGWDCHGLPIELNVTKENPGLSRTEIKTKCREYANKWVDIQKQEFKSLGVLMDWDRPYLTMDHGYEASIMQAFGKFVAGGYIERKNKTVAWCHSCQTVLASAEIEYQDRKDPSIYVQFPLGQDNIKNLFPELDLQNLSLLIWTTTPWTLPLNRAVIVKPKEKYVILKVSPKAAQESGEKITQEKNVILGKNLAAKFCAQIGQECNILHEFDSEKLIGLHVKHPFVQDLQVPVVFDQFVQVDEGTACVHCAPGCGQDDYEIGLKNKLEIFSPVSPDGKYTVGIMPKELEGMPVVAQVAQNVKESVKEDTKAGESKAQDLTKTVADKPFEQESGQIWVIKKLVELDLLLHKASIKHSYPHCWRCRGGLIFRATKQWFCDLSKHDLRQRALDACDKIDTIPQNSINRLKAAIENRPEWCLSRQRVWGVPIAALICNKCDKTFVNEDFVNKIAAQVEKEGVEYWDKVSLDELISGELISQEIKCNACGACDFKKETDILDVWFDSGVSHYAVLSKRKDLGYPADIYLEGKDQHRGWFQSSLLTSLVLQSEPCMKFIVTHGFTVDQKGVKMSKSLGNVVSPKEIIEKLGTDGLRLWVASIDCQGEAVVSDNLMTNVQEVFRKIRNTARFLLSNLYDFDIDRDAIEIDKMLLIDKYALEQLYKLNQEIIISYDKYDFTAVFHKLSDYVSIDLSSFYLDIIKDRLYVEKADGHARRSAQTACWYILDTLNKLIAPILSFTAEQISDNYQKGKTGAKIQESNSQESGASDCRVCESVHLQDFANLDCLFRQLCKTTKFMFDQALTAKGVYCETREAVDLMLTVSEHEKIWELLKEIRSAVLKAIEVEREKQIMRHSLEASVTVFFDLTNQRLAQLAEFYEILGKSGQQLTDKSGQKLVGKSGQERDKELAQELSGQDVASFFKEFLIVSQFNIAQNNVGLESSGLEGMFVKVEKASGIKCPRCWNWSDSGHEHGLCQRCLAVLG